MKIKWLGHASFLITSDKGVRIITDPYYVGGGCNYNPINEKADIVLVSHNHGDHDNVAAVKGKPKVIKTPGGTRVKDIDILGIPSYHDNARGKDRGSNLIFLFTLDGMTVCHLGDLGHVLDSSQIEAIDKLDVLLIPIGGNFTIDARDASKVCEQLDPRIVIPMHYKTAKCEYKIDGVDKFLKGKKDVQRLNTSETEIKWDKLPFDTRIVVLQHAL